MRVVIQRVTEASVIIDNRLHVSINKGLLILLGIEHTDQLTDITWLTGKISQLRIFNDAEGKMNLSIQETGGDILLVSQFTLYASTKKGNRPSYINAAAPAVAESLYRQFITALEEHLGKSIQTGVFGADMRVSLVNDGPVTIIMDSKNKE